MFRKILLIPAVFSLLQMGYVQNISAMDIQSRGIFNQEEMVILGLTKEEKQKQILSRVAIKYRIEELLGEGSFPKEILDIISGYHLVMNSFHFKCPTIDDFRSQGFKIRVSKAKTILNNYIEKINEMFLWFEKISISPEDTFEFLQTSNQIVENVIKNIGVLSDKVELEKLEKTEYISFKDPVQSILNTFWDEVEPKATIILSKVRRENQRLKDTVQKELMPHQVNMWANSFNHVYQKRDLCFKRDIIHWVTNKEGIIFKGEAPDSMEEGIHLETRVTFDTWPNPKEVKQIECIYNKSLYGEFIFQIDFAAMGIHPEDIHITTDFNFWDEKGIPLSYTQQGIRWIRGDDYEFHWDVKIVKAKTEKIQEIEILAEGGEIEVLDPETKHIILEQYEELSTDMDMTETEKYSQIMEMMGLSKENIIDALEG